jgi:hypothetical protein
VWGCEECEVWVKDTGRLEWKEHQEGGGLKALFRLHVCVPESVGV